MLANCEENSKPTGFNSVLNKEDIETLKKLTEEFADELALLGVKITSLEDDMQAIKEDVSGMKKDVDTIKDKIENGGIGKIQISGDMHVFHGDQVKGQVGPGGQRTDAEFRLRFDAKIDENISAAVRTVFHADTYGNSLGGAAANWGSIYGSNQNDVDLAFINMKNIIFKGDLRIGRDYFSHGSALLINDYVDAIQYSKKADLVDVGINLIYDGLNNGMGTRYDKDIWNLNLGYEVKGHKLNLDYYTQDYNGAVSSDEKLQVLEHDANGGLDKKGNFNYEVAYVMEEMEVPAADDLKGKMIYAALKYDTKKDFGIKLAYANANNDYFGWLNVDAKAGYHYSYDDERVSPFEDINFMNINNITGMIDVDYFKFELTYKPVNSKHSVRLAYDTYEQEIDNADDNKANVLTLDYRYQLAENTKLRLGYASLDGNKGVYDGIDDDRFFIEIYSKF